MANTMCLPSRSSGMTSSPGACASTSPSGGSLRDRRRRWISSLVTVDPSYCPFGGFTISDGSEGAGMAVGVRKEPMRLPSVGLWRGNGELGRC